MIIIRPEKQEEYNRVFHIHKRAFGQEDEARLVEKIRQSPDYVPELSLIAIKEGKAVGHILFSAVRLNMDGGGSMPVLSLAPMAVLPEFQKQSIGSLLVQKGQGGKRLGHRVVIVVGHPDYYPRFGFSRGREKGLRLPFDVPEEAFLVYELIPGILDDVTGIIEHPREFDEFV